MSNGTPVYWNVMVNSVFTFANVTFTPMKSYRVSDAIYQTADIGDGSTFASHCSTAQQITGLPG
jgi:hypothetical protein